MHTHTPFIIILIGEKLSGKGTVTKLLLELLHEYTATTVKFSDVLRDVLTTFALPPSRENFSALAGTLTQTFGNDLLAHAVLARAQTQPADVVILDGVRRKEEEQVIRSYQNVLTIYVTANAHIRYARTRKRKEKADEDTQTLEEFIAQEQEKPSENEVPLLGAHADITIKNNGTPDELAARIKEVFETEIVKHVARNM